MSSSIFVIVLFLLLSGTVLANAESLEIRRTTVVIMGAGASGISAALTLQEKGISDFIIVDAQSFIGGRVQHEDFDGKTVELGANWIYGKGTNPIYRLAKKHGLKTIPNDKKNLVYFDQEGGQLHTDTGHNVSAFFEDTMETMVEFAGLRMKRNQVDLSSRTALQLMGWSPDTPLKAAVEYFGVNWELAEPAEMSSLDYATGTVDTVSGSFPNGNDFVVDDRGFNFILEREARSILADDDPRLLLNTLVTDILYDDQDKMTILTANGTTIVADHGICTFSLGVLQNQQVKFTPELPEWKREALLSFHMTTYTKIFVKFAQNNFWGDWEFALYASNNTRYGGDYTVWQNIAATRTSSYQNHPSSHSSDTHNILMVTTTYKESEKVEIKTDRQVKEEIHRVLQHMFPHIQVPYPTDILIPRWRQNPLFHGSYSNWPIGMSLQHHENMRAPLPLHPTQHPRLWFAGEAMSQKYYGYLHGAWLNGQEVGRIVGNCLTKSKCHHPYRYHPIVTGCSNAAQAKTQRRSMTRRFPPKAPEKSANQKQKAFTLY